MTQYTPIPKTKTKPTKEENNMSVFYLGDYINIEIGQEVTIATCGSGDTVFGEPATLTRTTKQHMVFKTESGQTVKCPIDNMSYTIGKARDYFIIVRKFEDLEYIIHDAVKF